MTRKPSTFAWRNPSTLAILIWSGVLCGIAVHAAIYPYTHSVYVTYATGPRNWWSRTDLYRDWLTSEYRYSPLFAIAFSPFGLLPDRVGSPLWKLANALFFLAALRIWAIHVLPARLTRDQIGLLLLLALPLSLSSAYNGQANLAVVGALLIGLAAAVHDRWLLTAGCLAAATLVKGYPAALALLLAVLFFKRFVLRYAASLSLGLLLPFLTQTRNFVVTQTIEWLRLLGETTTIRPLKYRSVDQLWRLYGQPLTSSTYTELELVSGAIMAGLCLWCARTTTDRRELLTRVFVLFAAWVVLFGPTTEGPTFAFLAPALAWSMVEAFSQPSSVAWRVLLVMSLCLMGPLATDLVGPTTRAYALRHGSLPIGALLYLTYLLFAPALAARRVVINSAAPGATACVPHASRI